MRYPIPFRASAIGAALAAWFAVSHPLAAEPGHRFAPLTQEQVAAIAAACPAHADAVPAKSRAILVFYRTEGYVHDSIPFINEAIRQMGVRTGAFTADFSDDMAVFTPERLARYDAVVFQNTTQLAFKDPSQRRALLDFVRSGKGFVGIHAASDNFYTWPEAQAMLGGVFHGHPWSSIDTVAIKLDDPASPLLAAFHGEGFRLREEIYQITGPYSRTRQRVLMSLDTTKPEDYRGDDSIVRTDGDFPITWIKSFGKGRVFYTSLGHNRNLTAVPEIDRLYLDGIQFAIGDLQTDAAPPRQLIAAALAPIPGIPLQDREYVHTLPSGFYDRLAAYDLGPDRTPVVAMDLYLRARGPSVYAEVERNLILLLSRPNLPFGATDYMLRTLGLIGSDAAVPALQRFVDDPKLGCAAVNALFELRSPAADQALLADLGAAKGASLDAVVGAIGRRRLAAAIPQLTDLAESSAPSDASFAAVTALGNCGSQASIRALESLRPSPHPAEVQLAELEAAAFVLSGPSGPAERGKIAALCGRLAGPVGGANATVRIAALKDLAEAAAPEALAAARNGLRDPDRRFRFASANLFIHLADAAALAGIQPEFFSLDPHIQIVLLSALDSGRAADGFPLFEAALSSPDADVRIAAIGGLGDAPFPGAVSLLLGRLDANADEARAAADGLGRQRAPGVEETLIAIVPAAPPAKKAALLRVLEARADHAVFPAALAAAGDPDSAVRAAAFAAIAATARAGDLPTVLTLLDKSRTSAERRSMERALLEIMRSSSHPDAVVNEIGRTLASAHGPARYSLMVALSLAGTPHSRDIMQGILAGPSSNDRREVLRAIATAQDPKLGYLLVEDARQAPDDTERTLAVRDYIDLIQVPDGRSLAEINANAVTAWSISTTADEQDAIIAALLQIKTGDTSAQAAKLEAQRSKP